MVSSPSPVSCTERVKYTQLQHQQAERELVAWIHACQLQRHSFVTKWHCSQLHDGGFQLLS